MENDSNCRVLEIHSSSKRGNDLDYDHSEIKNETGEKFDKP